MCSAGTTRNGDEVIQQERKQALLTNEAREQSSVTRPVVFLAVVCAVEALAISAAPDANPHDPLGLLAWIFCAVTLFGTAPLVWSVWKSGAFGPRSNVAAKCGLMAL